MRVLRTNPGTLQEQQVSLPTQPSLHPPALEFTKRKGNFEEFGQTKLYQESNVQDFE